MYDLLNRFFGFKIYSLLILVRDYIGFIHFCWNNDVKNDV